MFSSNASQVSDAIYIEDVFSTYLYTGNGSSQTITNGINLSGKGGLIWNKCRSDGGTAHWLWDTDRGGSKCLTTSGDTSNFGGTGTNASTNFWSPTPSTTGYSFSGSNPTGNANASTYTSWTFRKQAKFFDVVTYTGNGTNGRSVPHSLGSVPGMIIVKRTDTTGAWCVYHRSAGGDLFLNTTAAQTGTLTNITFATSTTFDVGVSSGSNANASGGTYVAYLFAHNAGGFGAAGTDNVISCGSFTTDGSGNVNVNLGYEPQYLLIKSTSAGNWLQMDSMRGFGASYTAILFPNLSSAEDNSWTPPTAGMAVNSTGFNGGSFGANVTYIYIAIRRGPMKTPTTGTSVFSAKTYVGTTTSAEVTHDVTFDAEISANRGTVIPKYLFVDSLRGMGGVVLHSSSSAVEASYPGYWGRKSQRTMYAPSAFDDWWAATSTNQNHISYGLVRAPGFFDEVCYTGTSVARTVSHNLGVAPELMIVKSRSNSRDWTVYSAATGNANALILNTTAASAAATTVWNSTTPTASVFSLGNQINVNATADTYVAYLFATCPGVSKVGSYTGNGTNQTINCGFTGGARFILIKRTDSTGNWFVWDAARGIVSGNDPYLLLNSTAAEVTSLDVVDADSSGFIVNQEVNTNINVNAASYIFLAIS